MNTVGEYNLSEVRSVETQSSQFSREYDTNLYTAALLHNIESRLRPADVEDEAIMLGYAGKEEATVSIDRIHGVATPQEVSFTAYHGEDTSDFVAQPVWSDETPQHLRQGWSYSSREVRVMKELIDSGTLDDQTANALQREIDAQTDALSVLAVSVVTGGAVLPDQREQPDYRARQFDLAA